MDNESWQELEDTTNAMLTDLSWEELEDITNGFSDERKIGCGGYGVVYKGVHRNGQVIAVKKLYHRPEIDEKQFQNELQILTGLRHPNIVRLVGKSYKEQDRCVEYKGKHIVAKMIDRVICLEYLHNGSLEEHISDESSGLPWNKRYEIIKGICEGLKYLHERSIFHLDLKPSNILLDNNMLPKIADFGLSKLFSGTLRSHTTAKLIGTHGYMPPEFIDKGKISDKFDVFSLGVIIIRIVTGPDGYSKLSDMPSQDFTKMVHGKWKRILPKQELVDASSFDTSCNQVKTCIQIALNCLEPDRHKRPSIADIVSILNEHETTIDNSYKQLPPVSTLGETGRRFMGDIVVGLAKSVLEGVLTKAQSAIDGELKKLRLGAQRDLVFITGEFEMIHSFLNIMNEERSRAYVVRTWVRQVRDLAYDVEDCIEFVVHLDNQHDWWRRLLPSCMAASVLPIDNVVTEIEQIKARVEDVSRRNLRYSLINDSGSNPLMQQQLATSPTNVATVRDDMFLEDMGTRSVIRNNNEILTEDEMRHSHDLNSNHRIPASRKDVASRWMDQFSLVGRESQMNELRNCQTMARLNDWQVMSVWGIAGIGKSYLIRNLYYERMLRKDPMFDMYGWVHISHPFNLRYFCRSLLLDFDSVSIEPMRIKDPVQECHKLLKEYQCLVVIDDLQSTEEWDLIQSSLVSRHSKSVIIVITNEESIAIYCADNEQIVLNIKALEAEASFDLFKKQVQRKSQTSPFMHSNNKELEQLIVKCGGLPRVLVAVADFLATKTVTCMESTRTLNHRFIQELESNPEFCSLRGLFVWMHYYFHTCPDFLKPCIFYMSIFPGYQIIRRRRLVMRWVAEGYARDTKDTPAEQTGEMFFSMLVNISMILPPTYRAIANMKMILFQVNAFFYEHVISRPEDESIIFALEIFALKGRCLPTTRRTGRHLVIETSWDRDRIVFESIDFSRLRSLTVFGEWEPFFISESMRVLRVLDLENATGVTDKDLEQMVRLLTRLKFLSLRGNTRICHLPSSIGELRQLETLDVRCTSIVTLPASIIMLNKLQYMRAGSTFLAMEPSPCRSRQLVGVEVPAGFDKLTKLHTLGVVNAGLAGGKATLKELKNITQLRKLGVFGVTKKNSMEFCAAILCHIHLESLSVWVGKGNHECLDDICSTLEKPLDKTQKKPQEKTQEKSQQKPKEKAQQKPLKNLQSLKLFGLVRKVPAWIEDLPKLTKLELEIAMSEEIEVINVLGEMKELCILRLCVKPYNDGDGKLDFCVWVNGIQKHCYPKVKILEIACCSILNVSFGSEAMQNLELLTACCSSGSTLKFSEVKKLSKLKEVRLMGLYDDELKDDMGNQLKAHPREPALNLDDGY